MEKNCPKGKKWKENPGGWINKYNSHMAKYYGGALHLFPRILCGVVVKRKAKFIMDGFNTHALTTAPVIKLDPDRAIHEPQHQTGSHAT